jgi:hypothetical protein
MKYKTVYNDLLKQHLQEGNDLKSFAKKVGVDYDTSIFYWYKHYPGFRKIVDKYRYKPLIERKTLCREIVRLIDKGITLKEIGRMFGVSYEWPRRIYKLYKL